MRLQTAGLCLIQQPTSQHYRKQAKVHMSLGSTTGQSLPTVVERRSPWSWPLAPTPTCSLAMMARVSAWTQDAIMCLTALTGFYRNQVRSLPCPVRHSLLWGSLPNFFRQKSDDFLPKMVTFQVNRRKCWKYWWKKGWYYRWMLEIRSLLSQLLPNFRWQYCHQI